MKHWKQCFTRRWDIMHAEETCKTCREAQVQRNQTRFWFIDVHRPPYGS